MKQIIDFLTTIFDSLGYGTFHGLTIQVRRPTEEVLEIFPAKDFGTGEPKPIDFEENMSYIRLNQIADAPLDEEGCVNIITRTYTTTLVVAMDNTFFDTADEFIATRFAQNISNSLQDTSTNTLRVAIKADDVEVRVTNINLDPFAVWTSERSDDYTFPSDRVLISFDVTFVLEAHASCLAILDCGDAETELTTTYIDCDGVEKTVALFTKVTCTPCADANVEVNGVALVPGTVSPGATMAATLVDQNGADLSPVMTATNVMTLSITAAPTVTVTVTDDTPTFNQSITITVTSTGSPTSHVFYTPNQDGTYNRTVQAGNTLVWLANVFGTFTVFGGADDGSASGYDIDGISITNSQLVLDATSSNARVGCSLTKLRTAYAGNCIRVRRSSDNAELDIGFSGNNLDTAALLVHTGAGDGFVVTFYDQTGNAINLANATAAEQPRIVNAGVVELDDNGLNTTTSRGGGNASWLFTGLGLTGAAGVAVFVAKTLGGDNNGRFWMQLIKNNNLTPFLGLGDDLSGIQISDSGVGTPVHYFNGFKLDPVDFAITGSVIAGASHTKMTVNVNVSCDWSADTDWNTFGMHIFKGYEIGSFLSEIILFNADVSADRDLIEQHRMNYYQLTCQE